LKKRVNKRVPSAAATTEPVPSELAVTETGPAGSSAPQWTPRPYQRTALEKFDSGLRRQILIWHRRAGKDNFALNLAAGEMKKQTGTYWHLYPTHVQAKRAIWNGIDKTGHRFIDLAFPPAERETTRIQDMQIVQKTGSMWQLAGSDRYNSLVGSNPLGVVFSEWALCDPRAWDYVRPIIRENGGWVAFITTYRGRNHAYRMFHRLKGSAEWYCDLRTVDDTTLANGKPVISAADIQAERDEGMAEALIQQEYFCNPIAAQPGAVYGRQMSALVESSRLQPVGYDPALPVVAAWSNQPSQHTVAFFQHRGNEVRVIGSKSFQFASLADAIQNSRESFPWRYVARDIVAADAAQEIHTTFEQFSSVVETAGDFENPFEATRDLIGRLYIDNSVRPFTDEDENNARLVDALNGYRFKEASAGQSFSANPIQSWESHYAHAVENFAKYENDQPLAGDGWHPAPSTEQFDRAIV